MPTTNVLVKNLLIARTEWLRRQLDPRRDIDAECGYPVSIDIKDYRHLWDRSDIAGRVVSVLPEESWNDGPQVFETEKPELTEFEKAWGDLEDQFNTLSVLQRADILSGIGRFGVILVGIDDGKALNIPAEGIDAKGKVVEGAEHELTFLRTFDESLVSVQNLETDTKNPRYGQPTLYSVQFSDTTVGNTATTTVNVHWSRIIHVADNRMDSEVYGVPRMQKVFNRLLDVRKIAGGSGEMFWKGGFPGLSLESIQGMEDMELDVEATRKQVEAYMNGLQRYLATNGMKANSLNVQVADPSPHLEIQVRLIAMALGIPWRVFVGSEAAQLASEQDTRAWNRRLARRREKYITPYILRPFLERLVAFGILPKPEKIKVFWPDLNSPSDKDKADVAEKRTNAIAKYVQTGADILIPPFQYLTLVLGYKDEDALQIISEVGEELNREALPSEEPPPSQSQPERAPASRQRRNGAPSGRGPRR